MINFLCEIVFGSTSFFTDDSYQYLSTHLRLMMKEIVREAFSLSLRSRRTCLTVDELKTILQCRAHETFFGYAKENSTRTIRRKSFVVIPREILLQVEWLAIAGEQNLPPIKSTRIDQAVLRREQQMFFCSLQSKRFDEKLCRIFAEDPLALNICLSSLTEWFRLNISDCLLHHVRREKRRQLIRSLTLIHSFLEHSSRTMKFYLSVWLPIFVTCLFYRFDVGECAN